MAPLSRCVRFPQAFPLHDGPAGTSRWPKSYPIAAGDTLLWTAVHRPTNP